MQGNINIQFFPSSSVCVAILDLNQKEFIHSLGRLQKKYETDRLISLILHTVCLNFDKDEPLRFASTIEQILQELEISNKMVAEPCQ